MTTERILEIMRDSGNRGWRGEEVIDMARDLLTARVTIRDQFAMAALTGLLSQQQFSADPESRNIVADECYCFADAMIESRKILGPSTPSETPKEG